MVFLGWNTLPNGRGAWVAPGDYHSDKVLYAQWATPLTAEATAWTANMTLTAGKVTIGSEAAPASVTVPDGANLIVSEGASLTIYGTVTVGANGSGTLWITGGGTVVFGSEVVYDAGHNGMIPVKGSLTVENAVVTLYGTEGKGYYGVGYPGSMALAGSLTSSASRAGVKV